MATIELDVGGMHCTSCVARVEAALAGVAGVDEAHVNLATQQATVEGEGGPLVAADLITAVVDAGYTATLVGKHATGDHEAVQHDEQRRWRRRLIAGLACLIPLVILHHVLRVEPGRLGWWTLALATPVQAYVGWPYLRGAWDRLRHRSVNMDTLVALGTSVAFAHGLAGLIGGSSSMALVDAAMILTFITAGKYLESRARGRASRAIFRLLDLTPDEATVVRDGQAETVRPDDVHIGEQIVVRPGDRVPLDAQVITGESEVDESWLTGESLPVGKQPGSQLLAGTINGPGSLTATVTQAAGSTALDRVIALVRHAQESKTDVQRLADHVVSWFVPMVLTISLATLAGWAVLAADWRFGLSCAVAVLVVACPCALGLATPMAVIVGTGRGAERGILIKDAKVLETAGRLDTVVLDKTGTITTGAPRVVAVEPIGTMTPDELLRACAAIEQLSGHPLAQAVVNRAREQELVWQPATELDVVEGAGVAGRAAGQRILIGNEQLLNQAEISLPADRQQQSAGQRAAGRQTVWVAIDGTLAGSLLVEDTIASNAGEAVARLQELGLNVRMLSGDRHDAAQRVAAEVGIGEVIAEVLPQDKAREIVELQKAGRRVAMVGDGINDAPALATADLGIALGTGADVAIETADMVLVQHDLSAVATAIQLARKTLGTIKQNLFWAFAYNVLLLPLAAGILVPWLGIRVPPPLAAAAMAASSVSVVLNSLLLRVRSLD